MPGGEPGAEQAVPNREHKSEVVVLSLPPLVVNGMIMRGDEQPLQRPPRHPDIGVLPKLEKVELQKKSFECVR